MALKSTSKLGFLEKFVPVLILVSFIMAFFVGILWQKVSLLEKGGSSSSTGTTTGTTAGAQPAAGSPNQKLSADEAKKVPPVTDSDRINGSKDADILMIEYSDFECPYCEKFHPTANQAMDEYGDKIAWVYRHYPLSFHPRALPAANASECVYHLAGNDAFWKFVNTVFGNQEKYLPDDGLAEAAVASGANKSDFQSCFSSSKYQNDIDNMQTAGTNAGITGTPGIFIINKKGGIWLVPGAVPYEMLKATIDEALKN